MKAGVILLSKWAQVEPGFWPEEDFLLNHPVGIFEIAILKMGKGRGKGGNVKNSQLGKLFISINTEQTDHGTTYTISKSRSVIRIRYFKPTLFIVDNLSRRFRPSSVKTEGQASLSARR